jgi:hypothetical protein
VWIDLHMSFPPFVIVVVMCSDEPPSDKHPSFLPVASFRKGSLKLASNTTLARVSILPAVTRRNQWKKPIPLANNVI